MALRAPKLNLGGATDSGPSIFEVAQSEHRRRDAVQRETGRSMRAWSELVPERGKPLNFVDFPYQAEWYSDEIAALREVVWMKAAQVGMSNYAWRWGARRAEQFGDRVIYFFPTDDDVTAFGDQRIEPSIQSSEFLLSKIRPEYVRNKHMKRIGAGDLSLRGTKSKTSVQSVDADALVFDELEYHDKANLEQALRRLAGAKAAGRDPRLRWLGYPLLPGSGIHAMYTRSDQREWRVTCPSCGSEQTLTWERNMRWRSDAAGDEVLRHGHDEYNAYDDVTAAWRACFDCDASLEDAVRTGRWVARFPGRKLVGYHVSRLIVPNTDLAELVKSSRQTNPSQVEAFYNNDLGLPYVSAEAALSEQDVLAACSMGGERLTSYHGRFPIVAGVDVASERALSMWIDELSPDGLDRAIWIGEPLDFHEVVELIRRFNVNMTVIDSMPERRQARAVAATFPGRVILSEYEWRNEADAYRYDPQKNIVRINRTEGIDAFMESIRRQRRVPLRVPPPRFVSQLTSPKRTVELDPKGRRPQRVYVSTGAEGDDYTHAGTYALTAKGLWQLKQQVDDQLAQAAGTAVADERFGWNDPDYDRGGYR